MHVSANEHASMFPIGFALELTVKPIVCSPAFLTITPEKKLEFEQSFFAQSGKKHV